ncbi:MAG: oxygen-independent coproporphyrinogen III oxidase [Siphonobacter sp.]
MNLIQKYNVPGPRYTSYPTVPFWETDFFEPERWLERLSEQSQCSDLSIYIHLPFCESLCTFCGCHKRITKNHRVERPYLEAVRNEWRLYRKRLPEQPRIAEIHLGGGTPSFFSADNLKWFLEEFLQDTQAAEEIEYGFEGHPANTTAEHLQTLYDLGFRRVSFGVQDYDPVVQKAIHRLQTFEDVEKVTNLARQIGYTSVSHDLVFGLPLQRLESIENTIQKTILLRPDRISYYSYAHVPWIKGNGQRGFQDEDIPNGEAKRALYEKGREMLESAGYLEIGMDHFALPHDSLYQTMKKGTLHRNFMGYTTTQTKVLLGLGVSSISDCWTAYSQNVKEIETYTELVNKGEFPILKGHMLTKDDITYRQHILDIMCRFETQIPQIESIHQRLQPLKADGLIEYSDSVLQVTPEGRPFLRNICMAFDQKLNQQRMEKQLFSKTI